MKNVYLTVLSVLALCWSGGLLAQHKPVHLVTGDFKDTRLDSFLLQLESQTGYQYYFLPKDVDSIRVNLSLNNKPLSDALSAAFEQTELHYAIDTENHVFITKGRTI